MEFTHQKQYLDVFGDVPPKDRSISLLASGKNLDYEIYDFNGYTTISDPMRSQFVSALAFLSLHYNEGIQYHIVIIGGLSFPAVSYLASLFPIFTWDIWGIREKSNTKKITTHEGMIKISKSEYKSPKDAPIIFISYLEDVFYNMKLYDYISPNEAFLLFNVPKEKMDYFTGTLINIPWTKKDSDRTMLIVGDQGEKEKTYTRDLYLLNCFNHNIDYRVHSYPTNFVSSRFDHCYDCAMENSIWEMYLLRMGREPSATQIEALMNGLNLKL